MLVVQSIKQVLTNCFTTRHAPDLLAVAAGVTAVAANAVLGSCHQHAVAGVAEVPMKTVQPHEQAATGAGDGGVDGEIGTVGVAGAAAAVSRRIAVAKGIPRVAAGAGARAGHVHRGAADVKARSLRLFAGTPDRLVGDPRTAAAVGGDLRQTADAVAVAGHQNGSAALELHNHLAPSVLAPLGGSSGGATQILLVEDHHTRLADGRRRSLPHCDPGGSHRHSLQHLVAGGFAAYWRDFATQTGHEGHSFVEELCASREGRQWRSGPSLASRSEPTHSPLIGLDGHA